jgi:hypothetical protein
MPLLVRGGQLLRGQPPALAAADVLIEGERIAAVSSALPRPAGAEEIDATECIVLPGLINAHTHGHNNLLRGLAGRWTLEDLLNHGPAMNAGRTADDHYLSAAIGAVEMLKTGTTTAYRRGERGHRARRWGRSPSRWPGADGGRGQAARPRPGRRGRARGRNGAGFALAASLAPYLADACRAAAAAPYPVNRYAAPVA